jgi:pimeloyl-ACP methyl ester carboxylesterase
MRKTRVLRRAIVTAAFLFVSVTAAAQAMPVPDRAVTLFGQKIRYYDRGTGPAVVLLHGLGASANAWRAEIGPLSQHYRVLAPDQIGFGNSDKPLAAYSIQTYVDFLGEFLRETHAERPVLVGWSLGGWIAMQYALQSAADPANYPPTAGMVLVDSAGLPLELAKIPITLNPSSLAATREMLRFMVFNKAIISDALVRQAWADMMSLNVGYTIDALLSNPDLAREMLDGKLAQIKTPTLVIWGRDDALTPPALGDRLAREIPGARLVTIPECGHLPPLEHPAEFMQAVLPFLQKTASSAVMGQPRPSATPAPPPQ